MQFEGLFMKSFFEKTVGLIFLLVLLWFLFLFLGWVWDNKGVISLFVAGFLFLFVVVPFLRSTKARMVADTDETFAVAARQVLSGSTSVVGSSRELPTAINNSNLSQELDSLEPVSERFNETIWLKKIWDWADEFRIPEYIIPRDRDNLLAITQLDISFSYDQITYHGGDTDGDLYGEWERYIPSEICYLDNLTELSISCELGSLETIPESLGQLRKLTKLDLQLFGFQNFPEWVSKLDNLVELKLYFTKASLVPQWLSSLDKLQRLDLGHNKISELPECLGKLTNLTELSVNSNNLTTLPESMAQLTNLKTLKLEDNDFKCLPEAIKHLTNLRSLNVSSNQLIEIPIWITNLTELREVNFSSNSITIFPDYIGTMDTLERISVAGNEISQLPLSITNLENLMSFNVYNNLLNEIPVSIISYLDTVQNVSGLSHQNLKKNTY